MKLIIGWQDSVMRHDISEPFQLLKPKLDKFEVADVVGEVSFTSGLVSEAHPNPDRRVETTRVE
ncbi:MAG: hypothetical protein U1F83_18235 [Verrucomicrobiota bacterium]